MNEAPPLPLNRMRGLRLAPPHLEAAGALAGHIEDLTAGLPVALDGAGRRWVQYLGTWMLTHKIRSGDTLWALTKTYYGAAGQTVPNVQIIGNHPLNEPILSAASNYTKAIPGDVIVIPNVSPPPEIISQRGQPLPSNDNPAPIPTPVNVDPRDPRDPTDPLTVPDPNAVKPFSMSVKVGIGIVALAAVGGGVWYFMRTKRRRNPRRRRR